MRLRRPELVVDTSAWVAALDPGDPAHRPVRLELADLLEQARTDQVVLVSHSDAVLAAASLLTARGHHPSVHSRLWALAGACSLETLHRDVLAAAEAVRLAAARQGLSLEPAQAITIELARRRGATELLSTDPVYSAVGLVVRPGDACALTLAPEAPGVRSPS